jgi:hypothetical protein
VQVVHAGDTGNGEHAALNVDHRDVAGDALQQDIGALTEQPPRSHQD